jgi:hypothetical protein
LAGVTIPGTVFMGGEIAPGVMVNSVDTSYDSYANHMRVQVELTCARDRWDHVMPALQNLFGGTSPMTSQPYDYGGIAVQQLTTDSGNQIGERVEIDDVDPNGPAGSIRTLNELREHLDARLDEIDQALRLLVDP